MSSFARDYEAAVAQRTAFALKAATPDGFGISFVMREVLSTIRASNSCSCTVKECLVEILLKACL